MAVVLNFEDFQLFAPWFVELLKSHCSFYVEEGYVIPQLRLGRPEIRFHTRLKGLEIDVFVKCVGEDGRLSTFILEMKEDNLAKVLEQAAMRRELADYVYAVVNLSVSTIVEILGAAWVKPYAEEAFRKGVGLISGKEGVIVVPAKKFRRVSLAERIAGLTRWLGESGAGG